MQNFRQSGSWLGAGASGDVLRPSKEMVDDLQCDYDRIAGIGEIARFEAVMESVGTLENRINESVLRRRAQDGIRSFVPISDEEFCMAKTGPSQSRGISNRD